MTKQNIAEPGQADVGQAGTPTQLRDEADTRPWQLYLLAVAGALVTAFVDFSQNVEASAVTKATWGFSRLLNQPPSALVQVGVLGFFSAVSCVFVFTHRPKRRSHALAIGAGVLTALNLGVSTKTTAPVTAPPPPTSSSGTTTNFLEMLIPSAYAQTSANTAARTLTRNYVFVEGLLTHGDQGEVVVFDTSGQVVDKRRAGPAFQLDLSPGSYTLLFSQDGHRQVKLDIAVTNEPTAFRMKTRPVPAIQNFLGYREQPRNSDVQLGQVLQSISNDCARQNVDGVKQQLGKVPRNDLARVERSSSKGVQQSLCLAQLRAAGVNIRDIR